MLGDLHFSKTVVFLLRRSQFLELESTLPFLWQPHQLFNCFAGGGRRMRTDCRGRPTGTPPPAAPAHRRRTKSQKQSKFFSEKREYFSFYNLVLYFEVVYLIGVRPGAVQ